MPVKVKVVHLTSAHPAFDTRIFLKECRTLANHGYEVVLVAPHDHDEVASNVRIRALPRPRSRRERMTRTPWNVYQAALQEDATVYHFHDPELIPVGMLLKTRGKRVIYDVHELVSADMKNREYIPRALRSLVGLAVAATQSVGAFMFDYIVAATPAIASNFPPKKTVLVQNFPLLGELMSNQSCCFKDRPASFAYVGNIAAIRGIREMVHALSLVPMNLQCRLVLAGQFDDQRVEQEVRDMPGWERVDFRGWVSREGLTDLLANSRGGLVLYLPMLNHFEAQPNKLFEYMSAGLPVIASNFKQWEDIVSSTGAGLVVDPADPRAIADSLRWLLEHPVEAEAMGRRGLQAVCTKYNWEVEASKLLSVYETLTAIS